MEVDTGHDRHVGHEVHEAGQLPEIENSLGQGWGTFLLSKCILIFIILFVGHTKKSLKISPYHLVKHLFNSTIM